MSALPTNIITQLTQVDQAPALKQAYIVAVDLAPDETPPWESQGVDAIAFQYWPDGMTDSRTSDWNPRMVPGGSHPIYQWSHSGERTFGMTAVFTSDLKPKDVDTDDSSGLLSDIGGLVGKAAAASGLGAEDPDKLRNVPAESAVAWLRYFTYPLYGQNDLRAFEPPKCMIVMPNSGIAFDGGDSVICVMTSNQVTYEAFWPNGRPRIVEVALEFAEVVQLEDTIRFHSRDQMRLAGAVGETLGVKSDAGAIGDLLSLGTSFGAL